MKENLRDPEEVEAAEFIAQYLDSIAHLDMPLSAKIAMIDALRGIMTSMVDSAFGDDPIQHVHEIRANDEARLQAVLGSEEIHSRKSNAIRSSATTPPAVGG